ncbi:hypothetical protein APHAL10511_007614 [Amanita phalloides]|nr:hypothetical protein APHAL10511_007614 [Amanita phalloides]
MANDEDITQFCAITGASARDAKKLLDKYKRLDAAMDAYYGDSVPMSNRDKPPVSTSKLNTLFDKYKDPESVDIAIDGTIKWCEDLNVDPEDVVLLSVAYELKSPRVGIWTKQGWVQGWKNIGCDTINEMQNSLTELRNRLSSDPDYFKKVYNYTFEFARSEGQRSLALETAQEFWKLLLSHGLKRGALKSANNSEDVDMTDRMGWEEEYTQWWFDFLVEKGARGVSKDTWVMFLEFIRSIDGQFKNYDPEAAWPSTIDDFVEQEALRINKTSDCSPVKPKVSPIILQRWISTKRSLSVSLAFGGSTNQTQIK